ncbi:hypothetical protein BGZ95_007470 [Linnemannia exigua]|uniref:Glycosyltransferase family 71 protein n=1 Tax=Linnemannia exigua TaxID=604196 RepID=A0AAD4DF27_9FUNG|nr:hypothetical protein BGZ95_007470 [Linnemannia exigua]
MTTWKEVDTAFLSTVAGFDMMAGMLKQEYTKQQKIVTLAAVDFAWISRKERVYKSLWNHVLPIYQALEATSRPRDKEARLQELAKTRPEVDFFLRLEQRLFPWIQVQRKTSLSLYESFHGRGFVFCGGDKQFQMMITSIQSLRLKLHSKLPIQVFFMGERDLSVKRQDYLRKMTHSIEVLDITQHLDNDYLRLKGWAIKPFAILASKFEEAIFIDADAYFLRTPELLFDDPGYRATGALFFYDRTILPGWRKGPEWIRANQPFMSNIPLNSRSFRGTTAHEQESGVVLIDKKRRLSALLSVCKMNSFWERDLSVYQTFYGDKETFYIGFELVQEPYAFVRNYGGVIGELNPEDDQSICGAQMHLDYQGKPLWWNSGLVKNKNNDDYRDLYFGYWMSGGGNQTNRELIIRDEDMKAKLAYELDLDSADDLPPPEESADPVWDFLRGCMRGWKVEVLPEDEAERANSYVVMDKISKRAESLISLGKGVDPEGDWESFR